MELKNSRENAYARLRNAGGRGPKGPAYQAPRTQAGAFFQYTFCARARSSSRRLYESRTDRFPLVERVPKIPIASLPCARVVERCRVSSLLTRPLRAADDVVNPNHLLSGFCRGAQARELALVGLHDPESSHVTDDAR